MLAAALPDFGSFEGLGFLSTLSGLALIARAGVRREARDDIQWAGFKGTAYGATIGFAVWAFGLLTGLY